MLNPRAIAIQGIGFTPIYLAIQGLIEQIQEEQRNQVYGSGKTSRPAVHTVRKELTVDEVTAQWELLELKLQKPAAPEPSPVSVTNRPSPLDKYASDAIPFVAPEAPKLRAIVLPSAGVADTAVAMLLKARERVEQAQARELTERKLRQHNDAFILALIAAELD